MAAWVIVLALTMVGLVVAMVLIAPGADSGTQIIRNGSEHEGEDVREAAKMLIDAYASLVALISAAFGVIAFLVTFQQTRGGEVRTRAWGILFAAVVLLAGALILAFAGREMLLAMVAHNAVDIAVPVLGISRWGSYLCTILAAALTVWFAMEVAFSAETNVPSPLTIVVDKEQEI